VAFSDVTGSEDAKALSPSVTSPQTGGAMKPINSGPSINPSPSGNINPQSVFELVLFEMMMASANSNDENFLPAGILPRH